MLVGFQRFLWKLPYHPYSALIMLKNIGCHFWRKKLGLIIFVWQSVLTYPLWSFLISWFCIWTIHLPEKKHVLLLFLTSYRAFFMLKITIHTVTLDNIEELQRSLTMMYPSIIAPRSITKIWEMERKVYITILTWQCIKVWIYTFEYNINKSKSILLSSSLS